MHIKKEILYRKNSINNNFIIKITIYILILNTIY